MCANTRKVVTHIYDTRQRWDPYDPALHEPRNGHEAEYRIEPCPRLLARRPEMTPTTATAHPPLRSDPRARPGHPKRPSSLLRQAEEPAGPAPHPRHDGDALATVGLSADRTLEHLMASTLDELYAALPALPALQCRGLCKTSRHCHIDASNTERQRLLERDIDPDTSADSRPRPALTHTLGSRRCSVHQQRPTACRIWACPPHSPCPHRCRPHSEHVDDTTLLFASRTASTPAAVTTS